MGRIRFCCILAAIIAGLCSYGFNPVSINAGEKTQNIDKNTIFSWQGEELTRGNPDSISIADKPFDQAQWIIGPDGSLAILAGPGKSAKGGRIVAIGNLLKDGQEVVFTLKRYQSSGENGWKALMIGLMNNAGHAIYFNMGPNTSEGSIAGEVPEWRSFGFNFKLQNPEIFRIQKKEGKLFFYCDTCNGILASFDDPKDDPYTKVLIGINILSQSDAVLAELGPVEIKDITVPSLPPMPSAKEFPRIIIGTVVMGLTPYSSYFIPGGVKGSDNAGFYENAPLVPFSESEHKNPSQIFPVQYFLDLKAAGINAISIDCFNSSYLADVMEAAEEARKSGTGIKVLPMIDMGGSKDLPFFLQKFWEYKKLRENPNLLKIGDVPVVITFGYFGSKAYKKMIANAEKIGGRFFIISDVASIGIAVTDKFTTERFRKGINVVNGLYYFGSVTVAMQNRGILSYFMKFGRSFSTPKVIGASVEPGTICYTREGTIFDPRGTYVLRREWLEAIRDNPDFINLTTMNDYSEGGNMECSANATYSFIDLNTYFGYRWRNGKWPVLKKPEAFLSYRKAVSINEPVEMELVLLRPDITGNEPADEIAKRFKAQVKVREMSGKTVMPESVTPEVLPGHLSWDFWIKKGLSEPGYAIPSVRISEDGKEISFPKGQLAPFAVVRNGEQEALGWLDVPLQRVCAGVNAKVVVKGSPGGNLYPRTIYVEGLPWKDVAGGIIERGPNPLYTTLTSKQLKDGFLEGFYTGKGFAPMEYNDGWVKRCIIDQEDLYTAVIRMKNNTFVYPTPAIVAPPKVNPATVVDFIMDLKGGNILEDRGPMQRNLDLSKMPPSSRPVIQQDGPGKPYYLRFNGINNKLDLGVLSNPPGRMTLDIWFRPLSIGKAQSIFDEWGEALSIAITPKGNLILVRVNQKRQAVRLKGIDILKPGEWYNVVAVFDGRKISLYLNGQPDGQPVAVTGLRTDEKSLIGYGSGLLKRLAGLHEAGWFHGDIARFRILQCSFTAKKIARDYKKSVNYFK
ncbi:MAG: hypothetical protein M1135_01090 [Candidatus Omnitrophica bacterium]|nr:hypothetical protein [Candidatus Omnitrophota bacterium]